MKPTFHYILMSNHLLLQKLLLGRLKSTGLTAGQPKVLDYLMEHDGASQKEIAGGCHIEAGSLTSALNRMEEKGLVRRTVLNGNRRTFHIFLTEKGREYTLVTAEAFTALEDEAFRGISESDRKKFMEVFSRINQNLTSREESYWKN